MPRVVLIGSECSGKTSLADALSSHYKVDYLEEYSRIYAENKGENLTFEDVIPIAKGQIQSEMDFIKSSSDNLLLFDTCILSTYIYSKIYYNKVPAELRKWMDLSIYDFFFLTYPDPEWNDDGIRKMPISRSEMHDFFKKELQAFNLPFYEIQGNEEARILSINNELKRLNFI